MILPVLVTLEVWGAVYLAKGPCKLLGDGVIQKPVRLRAAISFPTQP